MEDSHEKPMIASITRRNPRFEIELFYQLQTGNKSKDVCLQIFKFKKTSKAQIVYQKEEKNFS